MYPDILEVESAADVLKLLPALPFEDKAQLPSRAGVYFVTRLSEEIIYVGKTNNFNTRWIAHHKISDIREKYNSEEILIAYCPLRDSEIDKAEALLINKFSPPLNVMLVPSEVLKQAKEWFSADRPKATDIPKELRLWVHKKCGCSCQVCGELVNDKRIGVVKYRNEEDQNPENLALICRSCRSRIRSNSSIEEYRSNQKSVISREIEKLASQIAFNFSKKCSSIEELVEFVEKNEIKFPNERN